MKNLPRKLKQLGEKSPINLEEILLVAQSWTTGSLMIAAIFFPPAIFLAAMLAVIMKLFIEYKSSNKRQELLMFATLNSSIFLALTPAILLSYIKRSSELIFIPPSEASRENITMFAYKALESISIAYGICIGVGLGAMLVKIRKKQQEREKYDKRFYFRNVNKISGSNKFQNRK